MEKVYQPEEIKSGGYRDSISSRKVFPQGSMSFRIWDETDWLFWNLLYDFVWKKYTSQQKSKAGVIGISFSCSDLILFGFVISGLVLFGFVIFRDFSWFFNFTKSAGHFWIFREMTWTEFPPFDNDRDHWFSWSYSENVQLTDWRGSI